MDGEKAKYRQDVRTQDKFTQQSSSYGTVNIHTEEKIITIASGQFPEHELNNQSIKQAERKWSIYKKQFLHSATL